MPPCRMGHLVPSGTATRRPLAWPGGTFVVCSSAPARPQGERLRREGVPEDTAEADLPPLTFVVPTGNFGNVLSGWCVW